jgi:hypothetical protein
MRRQAALLNAPPKHLAQQVCHPAGIASYGHAGFSLLDRTWPRPILSAPDLPVCLEAKTKGEADWRLQLPQRPQFIAEKGVCCFPAALGATHIDVPVSNSIDDHCRSQSSDTRRP